MKRILSIVSLLLVTILISSCSKNNTNKDKLIIKDMNISHETKFGGIYIEITIDDFNKKGFAFGDSLEITFSNGYKLMDLPYYNGYYTNTGEALLVGYPGYPFIRAGINNGNDLWLISGVSDSDKATITLNEKAKYLPIQEALDIHYSDTQGDTPDQVFGNFRNVKVGNLKDNILYRSASPADNQHKRAQVVDRLMGDKINTIINLSDSPTELKEHTEKEDFNSPNFLSIYNKENVIALSMNMNFTSTLDDKVPRLFMEFKNTIFQDKLIQGLRFMINHDGPYLVHCVEGKDRTGFVCMVLEAIANASYDEIINDYMITYDNYYGISKENNPSKYTIIKEKNIDVMLKTIINDPNVDIKNCNFSTYIKAYLLDKGFTEEEYSQLENKLCK